MALQPGTRLGPYEVLAAIGAGGMGEVYKARDTRLDRIVAIKVLPAHLADKPDLRERFEREARSIAGLNHPHICTLHDVGHQDGTDFLVMEYLEGKTLATRLLKGPLPLDQVLQYSIEISDALDKAHRKGVTHRDIKPGNIMLTKNGTKLLDFGLAKLKQEAAPAAMAFSQLPTMSHNPTVEGTILGTLQYMAPEQVEGKNDEIDGRTDIFALGAMVYEMATGRKAFEGRSTASLFAKILEHDPPPISSLQPMTPPTLDRVVRTCLAKEPDERWQTASDLCRELKWVAESGSQAGIPVPVTAQRKGRERVAWTVAAVSLAVGLSLGALRRGAQQEEQIQFLIPTPDSADAVASQIAASPDGRWIAAVAAGSANVPALFVREIASTTLQELESASDARNPFWSPDSRYIGYFANGRLKTISLSGGPPNDLGPAVGNAWGGTWSTDGTILFSLENRLYRIPASGGPVAPVVMANQQNEPFGFFPHFLPDGRHYLYQDRRDSDSGVSVGSLASVETKRVLDGTSNAIYAAPGYLIYRREETLLAQSFDAQRLEITGEAMPIADQVRGFSASQNGLLIYRSGGTAASFRFVWFDRAGNQLGVASEPGPWSFSFDLSPDGKQLVVSRERDLWVIDLTRGIHSRITSDSLGRGDVVWLPDGRRVAYSSDRQGQVDLYERRADGTGAETPLFLSNDNKWVEDSSRDGKYLVYVGQGGLHILPLSGDRKPFRIVKSASASMVNEPHLSPDGKWLVYDSNESGMWQVYAVSFPTGEEKRQLSVNGGVQPRWRGDGKEVFYLGLDGRLMVVSVSSATQIESGTPTALFDTHLAADPSHDQYVVAADGQRFLVRSPLAETAPITAVVNWTAGLNK